MPTKHVATVRSDSSGLGTLPAFRSWLNFEGIVLFSKLKPPETESLAEVQFVIGRCHLVNQSNCFNNSNKDCDWFILACFVKEQSTDDAT